MITACVLVDNGSTLRLHLEHIIDDQKRENMDLGALVSDSAVWCMKCLWSSIFELDF